ncbi:transposase [Roseivirga sp. BDSF3-8]|uniref:transposase n=1 Tax=Roseivirga sp. BDSF3-8 TaxID=3241598 RepID=UPI0035323FC8
MESFHALMGGSRQGVHAAKVRFLQKSRREAQVLELVRNWRMHHPGMGSRTMYYSLKAAGMDLPIGVSAFEQLLSRNGLTIGRSKRFIPKTSDGKGAKKFPNLTNNLVLDNVGQLIVGDITFFWLVDRWSYLFILKEVYSQRLLSLYPSDNMKKETALRALEQAVALNRHINWEGCIHHSDNGSQYDSALYLSALSKLKMKVSRAKSCRENGSGEQINHIIKNMYLKAMQPQNINQLKSYCKRVVHLMNNERAVEQLGYMTVIQFEEKLSKMAPEIRIKKTLHNFENST